MGSALAKVIFDRFMTAPGSRELRQGAVEQRSELTLDDQLTWAPSFSSQGTQAIISPAGKASRDTSASMRKFAAALVSVTEAKLDTNNGRISGNDLFCADRRQIWFSLLVEIANARRSLTSFV